MTEPTPDIRPYLEIRASGPSGFSPDGSKLLIASNLPGTSQLFVFDENEIGELPVAPDRLRQLTDFAEPVGGSYLPHEERLFLAMDAGGNERHQLYLADDHDAPMTDVDALDGLVVDPEHIHHPGGLSRDGALLAYSTNRRNGTDFDVWVRDLAGGAADAGGADDEMVWSPGGWAGAAGFSPDTPDPRYLATSMLTERSGDNRVFLLDRRSGETTEIAPHPEDPSSVGSPSWLPDLSAFFFSTDVGREFATVARYDVTSGDWEPVIELDWDAGCAVDWTGRHLLVAWNEDGISRARLHDPVTLEVTAEVPLPGDGVVGGYRFSHDGRYLAYSFSSSLIPGDTWRFDTDTGELVRVTVSPNDVDESTFVEPELVHVASFDGERIPAFVFRPTRAHAPGEDRLPVVIMIHGGPESQYRPAFSPLTQYLVAQGFAVIAPNVRGSTGYGKRYHHLDDIDKRLDSVRDLAALHDWIAAADDLDADRAALYGGSYGGYMVLAGLAFQPELWAAGVDVVGMSSLVTFLENTSSWRRKFREREYGSLEHHHDILVAASPITHVERMRAPLFIIHGANDPRVPLGEAEQIHKVLGDKGVRCDLRVYEDEGHGLAKLANRIDAYPRVAEFLHEVLGVNGA